MQSYGQKISSWWTRPCGGWDVLVLAVPMIISAGTVSIMNFTDRMFLLGYDADAMTAAMQAGILFWAIISLPQSIAAYANTFVAQYNGAEQHDKIGTVVWQGIGFGLLMTPVFILAEPIISSCFALFGHSESQIPLEKEYMRIILYCSGFVIAGEAAASYFTGRKKMSVVMYVNIFVTLLNIALDYFWIFGVAGFPKWGLAGAAWATAVSQLARFLIFLSLMLISDWRHKSRYAVKSGCRYNGEILFRLVRYGGAGGIQVFIDFSAFVFFVLLVGGLGEAESNATTLALTFNSFTFMPLLGTGIAVMSLVGNQLGAERPDLAHRGTVTAFIIGASYAGAFGLAFWFIPMTILNSVETLSGADSLYETNLIAVNLLRIVALYLLFDGICCVFVSALKGAGDMRFVMLATLMLAPIHPIVCVIGIWVFDFGIYGCWISLMIWIIMYAVTYTIRFYQGKWKKMRVIN